MKGVLIVVLIVILAGIGFFIFSGDDSGENGLSTLSFVTSGLTRLDVGHYEGWAIFGEEKVSTGKFNIGDSLEFVSDRNITEADKIVITIEPEGDVDDIPSGVVVLAGDVVDGEVALAFPANFSDISGRYILATPTNGDDSDETSGLWFLQLPPPPTAGLSLPALPSGWVYEGWAVNQGLPLTTGRFAEVSGSDWFNGFSGEEGAPPFPGEDYLENAPEGIEFPIDLADGSSKVVISVEPDIEGVDPTGDGPFYIKILLSDIEEGTDDHSNLDMNTNLDSVPWGTATLSLAN